MSHRLRQQIVGKILFSILQAVGAVAASYGKCRKIASSLLTLSLTRSIMNKRRNYTQLQKPNVYASGKNIFELGQMMKKKTPLTLDLHSTYEKRRVYNRAHVTIYRKR